jgi:hypothetical protein
MRRHTLLVLGAACATAVITIILAIRGNPGERRPAHPARAGAAATVLARAGKPSAALCRRPAAGALARGVAATNEEQPPTAAASATQDLGVTVTEPPVPPELQALYARLEKRARAIEDDSRRRDKDVETFRTTPLNRFPEEAVEQQIRLADAQARTRLAHLSESYRLNASQRQQVYRALVPATPAYHPDMEVVSAGGAAEEKAPNASSLSAPDAATESANAVDDQIYAVLEDTQKTAYEDDWIDRDLWWSEIIGQLSDDLDQDLASAATAASAASDVGAGDAETTTVPEEHVEANLFDLLNP